MGSRQTNSSPSSEDDSPLIKRNGKKQYTRKTKKDDQNEWIRKVALFVLVIQGSLVVLCMRYSRIPQPGAALYRPTTTVACSECLKIVVSLILVCATENDPANFMKKELFGNWRMTLKVGIPALLYTIQNNLLYFALSELDASVYQVLYQIKLLTTAFFSVVLLRRTFSLTRWMSLGCLGFGVAVVQLSGGNKNDSDEGGIHITLRGVLALFVAACLSGLAGVWFEKMLKSHKTSIWMRNVQLGIFSLFFSLCSVGAENLHGETRAFFEGYTPIVWVVVIIGACGGLIVAVVIKYADNILKGFATSVSIVLTSIISYLLPGFDFQPSVMFLVGTAIVMLATYVYQVDTFDIFGLANTNSSTRKRGVSEHSPA